MLINASCGLLLCAVVQNGRIQIAIVTILQIYLTWLQGRSSLSCM